jgi:pyruvate/2-oxoglutarate dehydrogenase complex dihydrolipoamide dehydrogenase (E3) component
VRFSKKGDLFVLPVEDELVGGEYHFWACMPPKAMLRPAEAIHSALGVGGARELVKKDGIVDLPGVWARLHKYADNWEDIPIVKALKAQK